MFREMRRKERQLSMPQCEEILRSHMWGVVSVNGDDGYPYGVPMNYGYIDHRLYIHCTSKESHKLEAISKNSKVCLTVVAQHDLKAEKFMTEYVSVIVFGLARIITDTAEKKEAMRKMMRGIAPEMEEKAAACYSDAGDNLAMIEITPEYISGKAGK